ncbi:MAG: acyl-CoA thioesterase [Acidimicrobiia bacterium]
MDFATMMHLEPHGTDVYVGVGPRYPWGGLYGGQIVAQALRAAASTVEPEYRIHSLHAYFIRRGDHEEPIRFEVDRVRNGRSFVTRQVTARQAVGAIFTMSSSFQRDEPGHDVQTARLPDVPGPEALSGDSWSPMFERRLARHLGEEGRAACWLKMREPVGDDPVLQACALAYLSDDIPTDAVVALHPERPADGAEESTEEWGWMNASLDHAIWFHRAPRADEWHLHDFTSHGYLSSRGLSIGHLLTESGVHVATVTQEVLLRRLRP